MVQVSRSARLMHKAEAALLSAIEVYNKPTFKYREQTFAILMLNAWELLLKAKLISNNANDPRALYQYQPRKTKSGGISSKSYLLRNRTGNPHTKGLSQVIADLDRDPTTRLPPQVKVNLDALTEVRDNSVHFYNASAQLAKQVLEIGTASVKNFIEFARRWFSMDLSTYGLYLMPIGFLGAPGGATAVPTSPDENKLVGYLAALIRASRSDDDRDFNVALQVSLSFRRSSTEGIAVVSLTDDPTAPRVTLSEEDIRKTYPWDYRELARRLLRRYSDFKQGPRFHELRQRLKSDPRYVRTRYLDPGNPRSGRKDFYNPNILSEFDWEYTRR